MIRSAVLSRRPHRLQLQSTLVPTRRQRAVSAAVVAPPPHRCSRTGHCGCSRCSGRRDGDWWKPCHSTSTSPTRRDATRTLLARKGYCAPHACADAQGCDSGSDCTALHCAALRCSALEGTAPALHLHCTVQRTGRCRRCLRPLPRVRTLRCGAGWSCGSDGDRRVLRDDDAAFVGPAS